MVRVSRSTHRTVFGIAIVVIAAGWALYGVVASDSTVFLAVMVVLSTLVIGGLSIVLKSNDTD